MKNHNSQLWTQIIVVGAILFFSCFFVLLYLTWELGTNWPPLGVHIPYWIKATMMSLLGDSGLWSGYWRDLGDRQGDLLLHLAAPALISVALAYTFTRALLYVPGGRDDAVHILGPKLISGRSIARDARQALQMNTHDKTGETGIYLHPKVRIPMRAETGSILFNGLQGGGKSVGIKYLIPQIRKRGDQMLIFDAKNEYTSLFLDENSVLLNPTDQRGKPWVVSEDITSEMDAELFAARLIPETSEPIWSNGARLLLTGCIVILIRLGKPWSWRELAGMLAFPHQELKAMLLTHYPPAATFIEENSKTTQSFFVTLVSELSWVRRLREYWPNSYSGGISVTKWLAGDTARKTIIIAHDEQNSELSASLCSAFFGIMVSRVLAQPDSDSRRIWFVLDELASLPKSDSLEKWLRLGRSKGARTIAGLQVLSQLRAIHGADRAETLLGLFSNVIALRMGAAGDSATIASKSFGQRVVERPVTTINETGQRSTQLQRSEEQLVRPEDLIHLPISGSGVYGYLMVGGWNAVFYLKWQFPKIKPIAEPIVRRTSILQQPKAENSSCHNTSRLRRRSA